MSAGTATDGTSRPAFGDWADRSDRSLLFLNLLLLLWTALYYLFEQLR